MMKRAEILHEEFMLEGRYGVRRSVVLDAVNIIS
jgi:hypothetical protein